MAESESIDCPCSNIAIMQLFHELKQSYPTVPDQIVSKVIQENYHDKSACETILQKESHAYPQSYPGAIISGNPRESLERVCSQCPASRGSQPTTTDVTHPPKCAMPNENRTQAHKQPTSVAFSSTERPIRRDSEVREVEKPGAEKVWPKSENSEIGSETETGTKGSEVSTVNSSRTCYSECESDEDFSEELCSQARSRWPGETVRWNVQGGGIVSGASGGVNGSPAPSGEMNVHNYKVAVQYSMQPALPLRPGSQQRSFTTVNLSLRPPSSEPQPPIEIQSGQNLTYTTSVFDAKKGVQSQLQIQIGPGGGGTVSACRTYISSPQTRFSCWSPCCTPQISSGFQCQNNHHLKGITGHTNHKHTAVQPPFRVLNELNVLDMRDRLATGDIPGQLDHSLLEKQRERRDLLARELRKEKLKLQSVQTAVRVLKAFIEEQPGPHLLPKLKSEIEILRAECEKLTAAVDLYSDTQNNLPLGETDEEFYRNIYTGQRLQREGSWSCQLCTFRNHPLLSVCEECEMPRITLGTKMMDVASSHLSVLSNNNTSLCTGGGTSTSASLITASLQEP